MIAVMAAAESGTLAKLDIDSKPTESRFSDLNSIMIARNLHDYDTVDNLLGEYFRRGYIISQIFGENDVIWSYSRNRRCEKRK